VLLTVVRALISSNPVCGLRRTHVRIFPLHSQQTILKPVSPPLSVTFAELSTRMGVREERQKELTENSIIGEIRMVRTIKAGLSLAALAGAFLLQPTLHAQDSMKQDNMKQDKMQDDKMHHEDMAKTLFTGKFHGKVHATSGRATVYQEADGKQVLRLTNFKTSNGPDVHVILVATKDAMDDANFLKDNTEKLELGKLKGNEGDQNYEIPAGTDLTKFRTVSIYCERFNANFGAAPLEKF
jgi:pentapeptide MXKDX repeat protein